MIDPKQGPLSIPRQLPRRSCVEPRCDFIQQNALNVAKLNVERDYSLHEVRLPVLPSVPIGERS